MPDGIHDGIGGSPIADDVQTADISESIRRLSCQKPPISDEIQSRFRLAMLIQKGLLSDDQALNMMQALDRESERKTMQTRRNV